MNLTNKNNSINNKSRRTYSHSFSNKDLKNEISQKKSKDNIIVINKENNNNPKIHENANTISVNEDLNYRMSFKRFNKIPIGCISHRPQKNKFYLKNESLQTIVQLSKEKKNFKSKIKSMDKYNDKNLEKIKYSNEPKDGVDIVNKTNEKNINKNSCSKENIIYSKKCVVRKQIQFGSPSTNSNSCDKRNINKCDNENKNGGQDEKNIQIRVKGGSQLNIFPKNNNQIVSERIQTNKKIKDSILERKTINNKDSNLSKRTMQKIIPNGITKKIKVNKIANLNG
jgi:hypothetical protein